MEVNSILLKEIDLIQNCIQRMAKNSFIVKGWLITLCTIMLALLPEKFNIKYLCLAGLISVACFWYLDAFFLKTETLYRWKYEWVITNRITNNNYVFDLNPNNEDMWLLDINGNKRKSPSIFRIMLSKALTPLYAPLFVIMLYMFFKNSSYT